jgi:hypothetical protein
MDILDRVLFTTNEDWRRDYWSKPVTLGDFITSKEHLNLVPLSPRQYEALYKIIGHDPLKVFSMERIKHVGVFLWGKGSGKDYATSILIAYLFYLLLCMHDAHRYFSFPVEEGIDIINISPTAKQARKVFFSKFTARIVNWNWLMQNFRVVRRGKLLKKCVGNRMEIRITDASVETSNNIRCNSEHSEAGNYEGYNVLAAVLDETSAFDTEMEATTDGSGEIVDTGKAEFIYNTLRTSAISRKLPWLMIIISFPRMQGDWTIRKYDEAIADIEANPDTSIYVAERGCTWEYNPRYVGEPTFHYEKWDIPLTFKSDFLSNPSDSKMRYCTEPPLTINAFFHQPQRIYDAIDANIKPIVEVEEIVETLLDSNGKPVQYLTQKVCNAACVDRTKAWALHVDLSISGDTTTLVLGHGEPCEAYSVSYFDTSHKLDQRQVVKELRVRVVIDQVIIWDPRKTKSVVSVMNVDDVVEGLVHLTGMRYLSYDMYQSQYSLEKAFRGGVDSEKHNIKDADYLLFRNLLHAGAISIPKHAKLIQELEKLSYDGKRVDHLPQYSKDIADGVAGVIRAVATGLAKPTDNFNFVFAGPEIFGDFSGLEGKIGQVVLPPDVVPGSEGLLFNSWGL